MDSCGKHGDVPCRFFCRTCSFPVCHVCMEKGDHVIPEHHCITLSQYCKERSGEIHTVVNKAIQHKRKHDQVKLKWDTHLSNLEGEFGKLKNEIRLTKQRLLQQMDLAEQSLLKTAKIAKSRKETAIKSKKDSYEQNFSAIYRQLNDKCQFLLRKLANFNIGDNEEFQECQNLLNNLQQELINFNKENLLEITFTFLPAETCFIGKVIAPKDADYTLVHDSGLVCSDETRSKAQKRMRTDTGISATPSKLEEGKLQKKSESVNRSGIDVRVAGTSAAGVNTASAVNEGSSSSSDVTGHSSSHTNFLSPSPFRLVKVRSPTRDKIRNSKPAVSSLDVDNSSVSHVSNSKGNIVVDPCCAGIVWVKKDWLIEISKMKVSIKIKHYKLSDLSQLRPDNIVSCNQDMDDVELRVCPKIYSPDCSFIAAFKNQLAIISLKGLIVPEVTWVIIPSDFAILAISWRKHPSQFVAIVKGSDDQVGLMRAIEDGSASPTYEVRTLSSIDFYRDHPFDVSSNEEFAICNTLSCQTLFFSNLGQIIPTRQVIAPCLNDGKPISVLVKDDKREWLVLWKGKSPSNGELKWAVGRYNASFLLLSIVMQKSYKKMHEEPKAFSVHGNKLAVLHNNLEVVFYKELSSVDNAS